MKKEVVEKILMAEELFLLTEDRKEEIFALEVYTVYIMVQFRKLLDHKAFEKSNCNNTLDYCGNNKNLKIFYFYANWVLHTRKDRMNREDEMKDILNEIHKEIKEREDKLRSKNSTSLVLDEVINMNSLREGMIDLISEEGESLYILENENEWTDFRNSLIRILIDQPIVNKDEKINKVTFEPSDHYVYRVAFNYLNEENGDYEPKIFGGVL